MSSSSQPAPIKASWLNRTRVRRQAVMLAVVLWGAYIFTVATPGMIDRFGNQKGADFMHFYVLGNLALQHRGDILYNGIAQARESVRLVPESSNNLFLLPVYGPQVSLAFAPLARLPYAWAFVVWTAINALAYGLCVYALWRRCPGLRRDGRLVALLALAYPAFFSLISFGQNSSVALVAFTLAYFALRSEHRFLAGLAFGLLAYKPQLGIAAAVVMLFAREWKVIAGALLSCLGQLVPGWLYYGTGVLIDYWHALTHVAQSAAAIEDRFFHMHSLRAFWDMLLPWHMVASALYVITVLAALAVAILAWRTKHDLRIRYSVLLLVTVLVAPHLTVYDLVTLAPALLFLADWAQHMPDARAANRILWLGYFSFWLPLAGPMARFTHVQLSVIALAALAEVSRRALMRTETSEEAAAPA